MKYSPQQQQGQKERKSESEVESTEATPRRIRTTAHEAIAITESKLASTIATTRDLVRRASNPGMFAWMRVFRLASMLHQVGC